MVRRCSLVRKMLLLVSILAVHFLNLSLGAADENHGQNVEVRSHVWRKLPGTFRTSELPESSEDSKNEDFGEFSEFLSEIEQKIESWQKLGESLQEQIIDLEEKLAFINEFLANFILDNKEKEREREKKEKKETMEEENSNIDSNMDSNVDSVDEKLIVGVANNIANDVEKVAKLKEKMLNNLNSVNSAMEKGVTINGKTWKGVEPCPQLKKNPKKFINWKPNPDRYLVALCVTGDTSHRLKCFQLYIGLAALLNRVLILPNTDLSRNSSLPHRLNIEAAIDGKHLRSCVGSGNILSPNQYLQQKRVPLLDVKIYCMSPGTWGSKHCSEWRFFDTWENDKTIRIIGVEQQTNLQGEESEEIFNTFGDLEDEIISFGEVQYFDFSGIPDLLARPNGPIKLLKSSCELLFQPDPAIIKTVREIGRVFLGTHFVGLYLHREDFSNNNNNCDNDNLKCESMSELATCMANRLNDLGMSFSTVYISGNVHKWEMDHFAKTVLEETKKPYVFVGLEDLLEKEWSKILNDKGWGKQNDVLSEVEKSLLGTSSVFFSSRKSTFVMDIMRRRLGLGTINCIDSLLCKENWYLEEEDENMSRLEKSLGS